MQFLAENTMYYSWYSVLCKLQDPLLERFSVTWNL